MAAALLVACSDSDGGSAGGNSTDGSALQGVDATVSGGAGGGATGDRLVFALGVEIRNLDFVGFLDSAAKAVLMNNVNEGLTQLDYTDDGALVWEPLLAESWERVGPLQWRFQLRDDVVFQNGKPLTAADVAFTINKELRPDAEGGVIVANLSHAEVVDDYSVDVFTDAPDNFVFRSVYRIGIQPEGWGVENPDEAATTAVGTGPYRLAEFSSTGDRAVLERWPDYWGDNEDVIPEIEIRVIPEAGARLAALQAGEVHVVEGLSADLLAVAPAEISVPGIEVELMRIDTDTPPLDNVDVRRAMNMAIDRQLIIDGIHGGFAQPANGQGIPPQSFGYNDEVTDYPYDPAAAREIIQAAGAEGAQLNILCQTELGGPVNGDVCNTAAQMLNDVGLDVTVDIVSFDDWLEQGLLAPQNEIPPPSLFYIGTSTDTLHAGPPMLQWFSCDSGRNVFCSPEIEEAMAAASALEELDAQEAAWQEVMALIRDQAPMVWLTVSEVSVATVEGVEGPIYPSLNDGDFYWKHWTFSGS